MTQNVLNITSEIVWIVAGALILLLFAVTVALPHGGKVLPGSSGHRDKEEEGEHEEIRPDGYIDSFAKEIEEAGGGMPPVVIVALVGILLWWLIYLIVNWTPH
jgi:hypothetical protein